MFRDTILSNEAANRELYERIYANREFSDRVVNFYVRRIYDLLRAPRPAPEDG